jgi:hypothetical protein
VDHLQTHGLTVDQRAVSETQLHALKTHHGVPTSLFACHAALIGDDVIEGHVPADRIVRLWHEQPAVRWLAVPGMPEGSPGMAGPNPESYTIVTFDRHGNIRVYAHR